VLETSLKAAHPFLPFVTETIWQTLAWEQDSLLIAQPWPQEAAVNQEQAQQFGELKHLVITTRQITSLSNVTKPTLLHDNVDLVAMNEELIKRLAYLGQVKQASDSKGVRIPGIRRAVWLDIDPAAVQTRLAAKQAEYQALIGSLQARLANQAYLDKAPSVLVEETKTQLAEAQTNLTHLQNIQTSLKS
jgi:valyl-tRNA synthetase